MRRIAYSLGGIQIPDSYWKAIRSNLFDRASQKGFTHLSLTQKIKGPLGAL